VVAPLRYPSAGVPNGHGAVAGLPVAGGRPATGYARAANASHSRRAAAGSRPLHPARAHGLDLRRHASCPVPS